MTPATFTPVDVLVVGAGNAAANAALAAHEAGASVAMLETAPQDSRGGNSAFTGGAFRFVYSGVEDLLALAPDIKDLDLGSIDFGTYTDGQYFDDMGRLTEYRCDPDLTEVLISNSYAVRALAAPARRAVPARARPPGLQGGREIQVLGRAGVPHPGRRRATGADAARRAGTRRRTGAV